MDKSRFSMLLLEPGEIYFEDYSCTMSKESTFHKESTLKGRLKLCSKSLVFEPKSWSFPLIKLPFKESIETIIQPNDIIMVKVKQYAEMLEENILVPYKFHYKINEFFFLFDFARTEEILRQIEQLQRASTLLAPEHNSMIATITHSRYMRTAFDPVMMDDFTEEICIELPAERITPLVRNPGKLALTSTMLYFQPFNNIDSCPMLRIRLSDIRRMFKRRFLLRQVGLELYSDASSSLPHIYLAFYTEEDRNVLHGQLEASNSVTLERIHAEEMTLQWQNGVVSNYDYLLYLNCLADRSKNDLTQYPVFPWVLTDYNSASLDLTNSEVYRDLCKPMGALNPDRLAKLKERYDEMVEPKFLYGSHYSAPGLVLFYLVRLYPQYMLCLQNGRFDHPDRMFNSVADVYNNCIKNMSDFKELIPEFYDTETSGEFLVNKYDIDFGERHDGRPIGDVTLPPWAESPEHFVKTLREALESEMVSRRLHTWIDLIFGYKQRGEEAVKADNVFHHVCYEGSVDLERVPDMNDRHALEVQIMEFGQIPKQLFKKPHPKRLTNKIPASLSLNNDETRVKRIKDRLEVINLHGGEVSNVALKGNKVISVGKDGVLKVYCREKRKQIRSVSLSTTPLSSCVVIDENTVATGAWDNEIYLYNVEYGRLIESFRAHDDSVSCLLWLEPESILVSGGLDCVARAWGQVGRAGHALRGLRAELDHDAYVVTLACRRREGIDLITGTSDGDVYIWNLNKKSLLQRVPIHTSPVTALCHMSCGDRLVSTSEAGDMCVTDLGVMHSIFKKTLEEAITSLWWDGANTLWLGGVRGSLMQWDMLTVTQLSQDTPHKGAINSIFVDNEANILATAGSDKSVILWNISF